MSIGTTVLKSQRKLKASSFRIAHWLFEVKMSSKVLMATPWPTVRTPCRVIFSIHQELGRTEDSSIFVRSAPRLTEFLLFLSEVGDRLGDLHVFPLSAGLTNRLRFNHDFADGERPSPTSARTAEG